MLSKAASYGEWRQQQHGVVPDFDDLDLPAVREICAGALSRRGAGWLTTEETRNVLTAIRVPVQPGGVARTADEAAALARQVGYPVVVKLASHQIVHKTEIGGVQLNLTNEEAVHKAFDSMRTRLAETNQFDDKQDQPNKPFNLCKADRHTNPDQEHRHDNQDEHEQQMMMRPAFFLIPMDFPRNFAVAWMAEHPVLLSR